MSVGQSQFVKNGQQINVIGGAAAIPQGALALVGGPGVQAWPAATIDYAARAPQGTISSAAQVVASALPQGARQPVARDRLGNIYVVGTNSGGNLVAYKYSPAGALITTATLDATATSVNAPQLFQLQSGAYACVYARAAGALYFVIFDSALNLVAGPSSVGTERAATNVVYHSACALSGGGLAIVFQATGGGSISLATYSNTGSTVVAPLAVQTLTGSAAQEFLRLGQLSSGNLVLAWRGAMLAGGVAGTSFLVMSVAGVLVSGPTNMDTTATLGWLELAVMAGFFALAEPNGSNLIAGVFSNAGAQQGSNYSVGNTLNAASYPQVKLNQDGTRFWLTWFSSAANGLYVVPLSTAGASGSAASALAGGTLSAATFALDAEVVNGLILALAASSLTGGQYMVPIGLPDASLGISAPYLRSSAVSIGSAAATTGCLGPRLLSGGGGLYQGSSPPAGQPTAPAGCGDFTAIMVYDQQNSSKTLLAIQKAEASAIVGICQADFAAGQPGAAVVVNPGPGEYPLVTLAGSYGTAFDHLGASPVGTAGALYGSGCGLAGVAQGTQVASDRVGTMDIFLGPEELIPSNSLLAVGQAVSRTTYAALFTKIGTTWGVGDGSTTFNLPDFRGLTPAGAENMGGSNRNNLGTNSSVGGISTVAALGVTGGAKTHAQTVAEMAAHTHGLSQGGYVPPLATGGATNPMQGGNNPGLGSLPATESAGSGTAFNVTQPTGCVNMIIYFA